MEWTSSYCERLARDFLDGIADRWSHVQSVAWHARQIAPSRKLISAAWLHDIGYAPQLFDTEMHALDGAAFLDCAGAPPEIVSLVAFHTGAEYEAEERGLVDQLLQFDRPPQDDLDALILADLLSGPAGEQVSVRERLDGLRGQSGNWKTCRRCALGTRRAAGTRRRG